MDRHAVLVFPGQQFTDENSSLRRQFGRDRGYPDAGRPGAAPAAEHEMNDISNLGADGEIFGSR